MTVQDASVRDFPCDLCGSEDAAEIACARHYTGGAPLHVCRGCGFVYVRRRRSAQAIADAWSDEIYETAYTARIPAIKARQVYVAEFIHSTVGLEGKRLCDIGAGEGLFLDMVRGPDYGAEVFGIEPSAKNGRLMAAMGIPHAVGTIEAYLDGTNAETGAFDVVTVMWTLENCQSCRTMLDGANALLKPGGHLVVSTGSRILVPFKKPLHYYLGPGDADTHAFRFSANALRRAFANSGFAVRHANRYIDTDYLVMVGEKGAPATGAPGDDWRAVAAFFERWHADTQAHYRDA